MTYIKPDDEDNKMGIRNLERWINENEGIQMDCGYIDLKEDTKKDKIKRSFLQRFVAKNLLKYYVFYLHNFNRTKLKSNLLERKERKGIKCTDCGECCVNCVAYNKINHLCKIWKYSDMIRCREFPITPLQLKLDNLEDKCKYYWDK